MTNQEIFDKASQHLLSQDTKSLDKNGKCAYRGLDNSKCAVGIFIPDNEYKETMEGIPANRVYILSLKNLNISLLCSLQVVHDKYEPKEWSNKLSELAKKWNLTL